MKVMDGKWVLMYKYYGVIVCGVFVVEAFDDLYYFECVVEV